MDVDVAERLATRQSVSSAISWSIRSEGFIGLELAGTGSTGPSFELCRQGSIYPRQDLLQVCKSRRQLDQAQNFDFSAARISVTSRANLQEREETLRGAAMSIVEQLPISRKPGSSPALSDTVRAILARLPAPGSSEAAMHMLPGECYTSTEFFEFERQYVFASSWICVGRIEQIPAPGDGFSVEVAGEPVLITRDTNGGINALAAICRHRGQVIPCSNHQRTLRCPLHYWTYDLQGRLIGAPRMGQQEIAALRMTERLPQLKLELWHGFIFVNLDPDAQPLAPSLAKVEPFWDGYEKADLIGIPPTLADQPLPWNWKVHVENFTDAYHPEFVHRGTHDFAPSVLEDGGVVFTEMKPGDNAIVRTVPMLRPDGGMMKDGWGEPAAFPPINTISAAQRQRLTFVMIPPSMTMVFAPNAIAFTLVRAAGAQATYASSDRQTAGGWLLPRSTVELSDFPERAAVVLEGGAKIWAQDVPENIGMQRAKSSSFAPRGVYGSLETTLVQFNAWLLDAYQGR